MKQSKKEEILKELKRIMGDKYYEGEGTDFTYENIKMLFLKALDEMNEKKIIGWTTSKGSWSRKARYE